PKVPLIRFDNVGDHRPELKLARQHCDGMRQLTFDAEIRYEKRHTTGQQLLQRCLKFNRTRINNECQKLENLFVVSRDNGLKTWSRFEKDEHCSLSKNLLRPRDSLIEDLGQGER